MRRISIVLVFAGVCIGTATARPTGLGLGLMGGDPSGISLKVWTGGRVAFDAGLGYSYFRYGAAPHLHGDVLWHSRSLVADYDGYLPLYVGVGARLKLADAPDFPGVRLGVRVPFGIEYVFAPVPIGLFLELVPVLDVTPPDGWFGYNSSIGFRYYFASFGEE